MSELVTRVTGNILVAVAIVQGVYRGTKAAIQEAKK